MSRDARRRAGLSQQDVATTLGVPRSAVSDIEHGRRRIDALELARFARLTGTSVDTLLNSPCSAAAWDLSALEAWRQLDEAARRSVVLYAGFLAWKAQRDGARRA
jgi:transcriptional regulator with XRE-family HTH domain